MTAAVKQALRDPSINVSGGTSEKTFEMSHSGSQQVTAS